MKTNYRVYIRRRSGPKEGEKGIVETIDIHYTGITLLWVEEFPPDLDKRLFNVPVPKGSPYVEKENIKQIKIEVREVFNIQHPDQVIERQGRIYLDTFEEDRNILY